VRYLIFSIVGPLIFSLATVHAQQPPPPEHIGIDGHLIVMPLGRILMVKRGEFLAALKFKSNEKKRGALYSEFECFEYIKVREGFVKIKDATISLKEPSKGFFYTLRRILQIHDDPFRYADKIEFKAFELFAHPADDGHSTVYFWNRPNQVDPQVRMAPTPWTQIEEVNLSDPRIKWFGYDEKRNWRVIPIEKLWE
jgi:hypothetical protein